VRITPLEDAIRNDPFRPFKIHTDGRSIRVTHPEQILLTVDKSTAVVAQPDGHLALVDVTQISSLTLKKTSSTQVFAHSMNYS
jgi:hypothetical protein